MTYSDILFNHPWKITRGEQIALDSVWNQLVSTSQKMNNTGSTSDDDDWDIVENTPFTEPVWGKVVNK